MTTELLGQVSSFSGRSAGRARNSRVRRLEYRSMDVAAQDRHFVAQHDDLEEIGVTAADESDELEGAAERR